MTEPLSQSTETAALPVAAITLVSSMKPAVPTYVVTTRLEPVIKTSEGDARSAYRLTIPVGGADQQMEYSAGDLCLIYAGEQVWIWVSDDLDKILFRNPLNSAQQGTLSWAKLFKKARGPKEVIPENWRVIKKNPAGGWIPCG